MNNRQVTKTGASIKNNPVKDNDSCRISKDIFLEMTNGGLDFFDFVMRKHGVELKPNSNFQLLNPFYDDKNASMCINRKGDNYYFNDFGDECYSGDVFHFAGFYYSLDPARDLARIMHKMCGDLCLNCNECKIVSHIAPKPRTEVRNFEIEFLDFSESDLAYWNQFGIETSHLKRMSVKSVKHLKFKSKAGKTVEIISEPDNPVFAYIISDNCYKIYRPNANKMKHFWLGDKPEAYANVFGIDNLPENAGNILITEGLKDCIVANANGFTAIGLDNAQTKAHDLLTVLRNSKKQLLICLDNDETGIRQSEKLSKKIYIPNLILPEQFTLAGKQIKNWGKDIADLFSLEYPKKDIQSVLQMWIDNAIAQFKSENGFRTANQRLRDAKNQAPVKKLMYPAWMTGEVHMFFGDTGLGKSIFAVGLADAISRGSDFLDFKNENPPLKTLYIDFELSDRQFEQRCLIDNDSVYQFSENYYMDTIEFDDVPPEEMKDLDKYLINRINQLIMINNIDVLFIDNLSYMSGIALSDPQSALNIVRSIVQLKRERQISVFCINHTPKLTESEFLDTNHMAGGKALSNFVDSVSAIGKSRQGDNIVYYKQIKPSRSAEIKFSTSNVLVMERCRSDGLLTFRAIGTAHEKQHLAMRIPEKVKESAEMLQSGETYDEICNKLGCSKGSISKWRKKYPELFTDIKSIPPDKSAQRPS